MKHRSGWMSVGLAVMMAVTACAVDDDPYGFRGKDYGDADTGKNDDADTGKDDDDTGKHELDGCTRTMGYWRNHNIHATNPNQQIPWPISEDTMICDETALEWLLLPPVGGNAFIILVRQWIVAHLNAASSADVPDEIAEAMAEAMALLADCEITDAERERAIELAEILDDYNNGLAGVPKCD